MELKEINELTRIACNKTGSKYHEHFKNEMEQKEYDRKILDKFSSMLPVKSSVCDAGCGPSGHTGKYLFDKGHQITGIDISNKCIDIASSCHPEINFRTMDMMNTDFEDRSFDGIISFYSIIYTPKTHIDKLFAEFNRILKSTGKLLVVVKKGTAEGIIDDEWYEGNKVYFTHFLEKEIKDYFMRNNFTVDFIETRSPYSFELQVDRIYAMGTKSNVN